MNQTQLENVLLFLTELFLENCGEISTFYWAIYMIAYIFISISCLSILSPTSHSIARSLILVCIHGNIMAAFKFGLSKGNENFQSL